MDSNRRPCSARAADGHFFARDFCAFVAEHVDIALAVCNVSCEHAVIVDDGVAGADDPGGFRVSVDIFKSGNLTGHGDIEAPDPERAHRVKGSGNAVLFDCVGYIYVIQAQKFTGIVVHLRGEGVAHRVADQGERSGLSVDCSSHSFLLFFD